MNKPQLVAIRAKVVPISGEVETRGVVDDRHQAFAGGLSREERLLIEIRDELYEGSWQSLIEDLIARRERKPYVIKLATRIDDDLARIEKIEKYEKEHEINLRDFVPAYEP
jgi:hypothetical protein